MEMLKSMRSAESLSGSGWPGGPPIWRLVMGLIAAVIATADGSWGSSSRGLAQEAGKAAPGSKKEVVAFVTKYAPKDADYIVGARPGEALQSPIGRACLEAIEEQIKERKWTRGEFAFGEIEQIVAAGTIEPTAKESSKTVVVLIRSMEPGKLMALFSREKNMGVVGGVGLFVVKEGLVWGAVDDRTILLGSVPALTQALRGGGGSPLTSSTVWASQVEAKSTPLVGVVRSEAVRAYFKMQPAEINAMFATAAPIWDDSQTLGAAFFASDRLGIQYRSEQANDEASQRVLNTLNSLKNESKNLAHAQLQKVDSLKPMQLQGYKIAERLLDSVEFSGDGRGVAGKISTAADEKLMAMVTQMIADARMASQRQVSFNNLREIARALHQYHDTMGRLPTSVLLGPDGKTPYSWRVEILPFMEQQQLYDQYKFDEPWDSESNKKLLAQVPAIFQHPSEKGKSTNASYFAIAGEKTILNSTSIGTKVNEIPDGTTNTIMVVEAKKETPWTKPEDFSVDVTAAALGYSPGHFCTALGDGSVRLIPKTIDATMLKWLFLKNDGNAVTIP